MFADDVVRRRRKDVYIGWGGCVEEDEQATQDLLVNDLRRRRHDEDPVDELVAVTVVRHRLQVVVGERRALRQHMRHAHQATDRCRTPKAAATASANPRGAMARHMHA